MKIAVIGAGISGLGAAYLLGRNHDVTVYEAADYPGGHSRTIDVPDGWGGTVPVDTGFIVFNHSNYPHLTGLFRTLKVPTQKSAMSFAASIGHGWLEYSSHHVVAQAKNLVRPAFWGMILDILRFNRRARAWVTANPDMTLGQCLDALGVGAWFRRYYILPMGAAIWSSPLETITRYPARTFVHFFHNHGLLSVNRHPQWYTVSGGSRTYVKRLLAAFSGTVKCDCGAHKIRVHQDGVTVIDTNGASTRFDQAVVACHADQALNIIEHPTAQERDVLGCFAYRENRIVVHKDPAFMPTNRTCWASWVYMADKRRAAKNVPAQNIHVSYWMNNLQNLVTAHPVLITLNPPRRVRADMVFDEHRFSHPVFDFRAVEAQTRIPTIQGRRGLWFCGAYQSFGFHEDGLASAVRVARQLGTSIPWE